MRTRRVPCLWLLGLPMLAGCVTAFGEGVTAAREGRYTDATTYFERALAEDPDRIDALVALGVARYKLGAFDAAVEALERARARAPRDADVRLYLALSHLQMDALGPAEEHLSAFADIASDRRIAAQAQRALRLLRGDPLDAETRAFVAASLDDEAELARELGEARRALAWAQAWPYAWRSPACFVGADRVRCY